MDKEKQQEDICGDIQKKEYDMAKREVDLRLKKLFDEKKQVYSISKANTIEECLLEAYNTYVLHKKGVNGIYGILGTKIH